MRTFRSFRKTERGTLPNSPYTALLHVCVRTDRSCFKNLTCVVSMFILAWNPRISLEYIRIGNIIESNTL